MLKRMLALFLAAMFLLPAAAIADDFNPYRPLAYMDARFTCGCQRGGTGTMVGPYGLLTAAHNLYCPEHGKPLKTCDFYFGAVSRNSCWYKYDGKFTYTVYDTFQGGYNSQNDIGFVIFETAVGRETGWYACMVGTDHDLHEEFAHVYTYNTQRKLEYQFVIQYTDDPLQLYWEEWLPGTDGGPVFFASEDFESPTVTAVYTSHDDNGYGYGRRLTQDVFNDMKAAGAFD